MIESFIILFLDLVDYSKNNELIQIEFFKKFQREVYHILYDEIIENKCVLIPTGDGMIVGLINNKDHTTFIKSIQILVDLFIWARHNNYAFRSALHVGDVNVIFDINKNKNLIGNLVNDASRILSAGDAESIIVSDVYFNKYLRNKETQIGIEYSINDKYSYFVIDEGSIADKHNYVHNVYSIILKYEDTEYGCNKKLDLNYKTIIYSSEYPKNENLKKSFIKKVQNCTEIQFYGIYNKSVLNIIKNIHVNEKRDVSISIAYASDNLEKAIKEYFVSDSDKLNIETKKVSINVILNWYKNHKFKEFIKLNLFEYEEIPSFGASFVDLNIQGSGFIHISNYLRNVAPDKTPYFEISWNTKKMPSIYKYYRDLYVENIASNFKKIGS